MDENKKAAQKKKISHFITIAVLVILFLAFIFPFIMVIINAFKTKGDITADPLALVGSHGFILYQLHRCNEENELRDFLYELTDHHNYLHNFDDRACSNDCICNCA